MNQKLLNVSLRVSVIMRESSTKASQEPALNFTTDMIDVETVWGKPASGRHSRAPSEKVKLCK